MGAPQRLHYQDRTLAARVAPPPALIEGTYSDRPPARPDDWGGLSLPATAGLTELAARVGHTDKEGGIRREPELPEHEEIVSEPEALYPFRAELARVLAGLERYCATPPVLPDT